MREERACWIISVSSSVVVDARYVRSVRSYFGDRCGPPEPWRSSRGIGYDRMRCCGSWRFSIESLREEAWEGGLYEGATGVGGRVAEG